MVVNCPKCQSEQIVKRGIRLTERRENIQKYFCKSCNYRFSIDNPFFRMRNHQQMITQCTDMYYSGMSFRKIADHLRRFFPKNVHYSTIYRWIIKYVPIMENFTEKQKINAGWQLQGDEVEYKRRISKNGKGIANEFFIDIIDIESRYLVASQYSANRDTTALKKVYIKARNKVGDNVKVISTDGLNAYPRVLRKTFGLKAQATKNPKIIHQIIKSDSGKFNYKVERFHNTLRERTKVMRGFHGSITSAQTLMRGYEIYYNWIKNHLALKGKTPSQVAVPHIELSEKNGWLQLIQLGYKEVK